MNSIGDMIFTALFDKFKIFFIFFCSISIELQRQACNRGIHFWNVAKASLTGLNFFFSKSAKLVQYIFISCRKLYYSNTLSLDRCQKCYNRDFKVRVYKSLRLKLGSLEIVSRWHYFPYEKQHHLPAECCRKFIERKLTQLIQTVTFHRCLLILEMTFTITCLCEVLYLLNACNAWLLKVVSYDFPSLPIP